MEDFSKLMAQKRLEKVVDKKYGNVADGEKTENYTQEFLSTMPIKKFRRLLKKAQREGDKDTLAAILSNWPANKNI